MPEPFKNLFNARLLEGLAFHLKRIDASLDVRPLTAKARVLAPLELKQRAQWITAQLDLILPTDMNRSFDIIRQALHPEEEAPLADMVLDDLGIRGWAIMPLADLVVLRGLDEPEQSMALLAELTKRFSAEFAVRPFIDRHPKLAFGILKQWAKDSNAHVRRLASEGSRPRLPWGMQLKKLVQNPRPLRPLLNILRADPSAYVRKSVANNLNDISKDHPEWMLDLAETWHKKGHPHTQSIVKHGLRTLIKKGDSKALSILGVGKVNVKINAFSVVPKSISVGDELTLALSITSLEKQAKKVLVDYLVYHVKANGSTAPKVFKWKSFDLAPGEIVELKKRHSFKVVTTRQYYPGEHSIAVQLNGKVVIQKTFILK